MGPAVACGAPSRPGVLAAAAACVRRMGVERCARLTLQRRPRPAPAVAECAIAAAAWFHNAALGDVGATLQPCGAGGARGGRMGRHGLCTRSGSGPVYTTRDSRTPRAPSMATHQYYARDEEGRRAGPCGLAAGRGHYHHAPGRAAIAPWMGCRPTEARPGDDYSWSGEPLARAGVEQGEAAAGPGLFKLAGVSGKVTTRNGEPPSACRVNANGGQEQGRSYKTADSRPPGAATHETAEITRGRVTRVAGEISMCLVFAGGQAKAGAARAARRLLRS
jgi:hypothetical protein